MHDVSNLLLNGLVMDIYTSISQGTSIYIYAYTYI